ncbi:MAG TPA: rod shape-determining protein MreD [Anaerolineales bacterium]|nr:rod shape-determining protein MreD [Anaerolineales bacterium]
MPMATLISIPVFALLMILQSSLFSRIPLLYGTLDLFLLVLAAWALQKRVQTAWQWSIVAGLIFNFVSALPLGAPLIGYGLSTGIALALRRQVWQYPLLAMFAAVFFGTLITHAVSLTALRLVGHPIPVLEAFNLITLPSLLLNLMLAAPAYALIGDLAARLYPEPLES